MTWGWLAISAERDPMTDDYLMYGEPDAGKFERPPETVYEPGGADVRLALVRGTCCMPCATAPL